jgi:hypothetical protein
MYIIKQNVHVYVYICINTSKQHARLAIIEAQDHPKAGLMCAWTHTHKHTHTHTHVSQCSNSECSHKHTHTHTCLAVFKLRVLPAQSDQERPLAYCRAKCHIWRERLVRMYILHTYTYTHIYTYTYVRVRMLHTHTDYIYIYIYTYVRVCIS